MTSDFGKEEVDFFKSLLQNEIRPDGRLPYQSKDFQLIENPLQSTIFSLELKNKDTNIYFSLKAELSKNYQPISIACDSIKYKPTNRKDNIPSINEVSEILFLLDKLILQKVPKKTLSIDNNENYFWNLNVNIFSLEKIYINNLQSIAQCLTFLLKNAKLPRISIFKNELNGELDYDIVENEYYSLDLELCEFLVVGSYLGNLFVDPSLEELTCIEALILITLHDNKISHFETYGVLVDIGSFSNIDNFILKIKDYKPAICEDKDLNKIDISEFSDLINDN